MIDHREARRPMKSGFLVLLVAIGLVAAGRDRGSPRPAVPALANALPAAPAGGALQPLYAEVDYRAVPGTSSNTNGMLETQETVQVSPFWTNVSGGSQAFTGTASNISGPPGPAYGIDDTTADYGTLGNGATGDCNGATGDCYVISVTGPRPTAHWDLTFTETLSFGSIATTWIVHVGGSFADVPTTHLFYSYVEELFHLGVTGGCGGGNYCPSSPVTRAQMAVFLLKSKFGADHVPPPATGTVFNDVPIDAFAAAWIEELASLQITGGCGSGNYCPNDPVTRAQMAVFILKTEHGSGYIPPSCIGVFADVPCPSLYAGWIEQLYSEGITGGCGNGNYCPNAPNTRGEMAVFLVRGFGPPAPPVPTPTPRPPTLTPTNTPSPTPVTPTRTPTITPTVPTPTRTPTVPTPTSTPITPTNTSTPSPTSTLTPTRTLTPTKTLTPTRTFTRTFTLTPSVTPSPTPNPNHVVTISNFQFVDSVSGTSNTTITAGETVEWVWAGGTHSTTSGTCSSICTPDLKWDSQVKSTPFTYTHTFTASDGGQTFSYYCQLHGISMGMTGVVSVLPAAPSRGTR
jgi:plastocyanin